MKIYYDYNPKIAHPRIQQNRFNLPKGIKPIFQSKFGRIGMYLKRPDLVYQFSIRDLRIKWVSHIECLSDSIYIKQTRNKVIRGIESENCKGVFTLSKIAKKSFELLDLPTNKVDVLYPASYSGKRRIHKGKGNINLLFSIGRNKAFFLKGGEHVIETFKILKKEFPKLTLTILGDCREEIKKSSISGISFIGYIERNRILKEILPKADIYVEPTHIDSFGFSFVEAMAFCLPIVATKHYAIPEFIEDGKNGFLIKDINKKWYDENYVAKDEHFEWYKEDKIIYTREEAESSVEAITKAIRRLILNPKLRQRMGDYNFQEISDGKLSFKERNKKLRGVCLGLRA